MKPARPVPNYSMPDQFSIGRQPRTSQKLLPSTMQEDNAVQRNGNPHGPSLASYCGSMIPAAFKVMEIDSSN